MNIPFVPSVDPASRRHLVSSQSRPTGPGKKIRAGACALLIALSLPACADVGPQMFGVNLSGGEHNSTIIPGTFGTHYLYPTQAEFDYYKARNLNMIRMPILWERIQRPLNTALIESEMNRIDQAISYARNSGMKIILDLHNYNTYKIGTTAYEVGTTQVPYSAFADVWSRLAFRYKNEPAIYGYDLMNEPSPMGLLSTWQTAAQAATNAIRVHDTQHWILVEGIRWSGTQQWRAYNETLHVSDSADRLIYSAHSYWSINHQNLYTTYATGSHNINTSGAQVSAYPEMGIDHLEPFVEWIKEHGYNGHIGEYGIPTYPTDPAKVSQAEAALWNVMLDKALAYLQNNGISGTYWAGGIRMSGSAYNIGCQPASLSGPDKTVMAVMRKYAGSLFFEGESTPATATDPLSTFTDPLLSYGAARKVASNAIGDSINYTVPVPLAGTYTVKVGVKRYTLARGRFQLSIDGVAQGAVQDQHGPSGNMEFNLGNKTLTTGNKSFRFTVAGKNPASTGYELTFDYIKLDPVAPTLVQVTADNSSATVVGSWNSGNGTEGYFFTDYLSDGGSGKGLKNIRFTPNIPSAGTYKVYGRWVGSGTGRSPHVPLEITHAGGVDTTKWVNQQVGGGSWVLVGTYTFNAGTGGNVLLKNLGTTGIVMADAFRFIKQ